MTSALFDIINIIPLVSTDMDLFKEKYFDKDAFDMPDNEESILSAVCQYLSDEKKCIFYSPYENKEYYVSTALDSFIIDSNSSIKSISSKESFSFEIILGESDEDAIFYFDYNKLSVSILKKALLSNEDLYTVNYSFDEIYYMFKKIYNYIYMVCENLLDDIYFKKIKSSGLIMILA